MGGLSKTIVNKNVCTKIPQSIPQLNASPDISSEIGARHIGHIGFFLSQMW